MFLPWCLGVWVSKRLGHSSLGYFAAATAVATFIVGCATSSLLPKPLFIEDQTFSEGFRIAVERQGLQLVITGLIGGVTYWFISERRRQTN